ncbi:site-specific DNA-methyltransferase (adenine-specific) [Micromonospora sp. A200]|uniref:DNA-methyltransferase n=1 Tax=Micromonospora sp. A200 TaxID=2940568 RepID=UPI002474A3FD|nr:site-specific DNA-methyltransferase [Micromonospora sp. A200]MDH6460142.1 site-specific DNA-methyltransferase (adenine-specific) [Micromonospora sp. A200]
MKPYYADDTVTLYHGDSREILPILDLQPDCIVTDPPYGETSLEWDRWPDGWPTVAAKLTSSMWCFGSMRMFLDRRDEFAGWKLSQDVVWRKNVAGFQPGDRFNRIHEHALHFYRGAWGSIHHTPPRVPAVRRRAGDLIGRAANEPGVTGARGASFQVSDGLAYHPSVVDASISRTVSQHPTEKPVRLLDPLIRYACPPGGLVLDLFGGSGSTADAARMSGRRAVLIEANEGYCEAIADRLAQGVLPMGEVA